MGTAPHTIDSNLAVPVNVNRPAAKGCSDGWWRRSRWAVEPPAFTQPKPLPRRRSLLPFVAGHRPLLFEAGNGEDEEKTGLVPVTPTQSTTFGGDPHTPNHPQNRLPRALASNYFSISETKTGISSKRYRNLPNDGLGQLNNSLTCCVPRFLPCPEGSISETTNRPRCRRPLCFDT